LNKQPISVSFYQHLCDITFYIQTHYQYYSGAVIGMLLDNKRWEKYGFLKYVFVSIIVAHLTEIILKDNGTSLHISILICTVVGLVGHATLRYTTDEALPKVLKAITDRILDKINKN
jgi:hypothetical protein